MWPSCDSGDWQQWHKHTSMYVWNKWWVHALSNTWLKTCLNCWKYATFAHTNDIYVHCIQHLRTKELRQDPSLTANVQVAECRSYTLFYRYTRWLAHKDALTQKLKLAQKAVVNYVFDHRGLCIRQSCLVHVQGLLLPVIRVSFTAPYICGSSQLAILVNFVPPHVSYSYKPRIVWSTVWPALLYVL